MSTRLVRDVVEADRNRLSALLSSTREFTAEEVDVALELIDLAIAQTDDYEVLVAESAGQLEGYICFGPTPMTEGTFDLYWIAAATHARRTGVGIILVEAMEQRLRARGARLVRIETSSREEYEPTRRFYQRIGYPIAATLRNFYAKDDDLVIYLQAL